MVGNIESTEYGLSHQIPTRKGISTMAQKVTVTLLDDIDGSAAAETVTFALDGNAYEIDLSETNVAALRTALTPFTEHARKMTRTTRAARKSAVTGVDTKAVREWAKSQGIRVSARGRIPGDVVERYQNRDAKPAAKPAAKKAAKSDKSDVKTATGSDQTSAEFTPAT